jgi:GYF domain 2
MNYYYAGPDEKPVGPYTLNELRELRYQGKLNDDSFVIEEGGTQWKRFSEMLAPPIPQDAVGTPTPPPPGAVEPATSTITAPSTKPITATNHQPLDVGMAVLWFICCYPIGFMQWGQTAKGWLWLLITCFTFGVGWVLALVDYWMCFVAQQKRPLGEWEFFPQ